VRQLAWHRREDQPAIVAASQLPQPHAIGPEPDLDGLPLQLGELPTRLDADALEQRGERGVGLEDGDGESA
jgi:hypothetical protein